ncbi:MAG: hypothetical protein NTW49_01780, partial [Bacteroidia bacterium]|nr:hypothetical protein [Bacteroidia bacterium]
MSSVLSGYEYDIFISYRQKDNKYDGWVTEFVDHLKKELEATFKEDVSVYFDINPHDGLLETHDVDESLRSKLKCLVFIPIISRTYCDPKSFAWDHEFKAFIDQASHDQFGLKVKLSGGNVASRVLPVRIHDLEPEDIKLSESYLGTIRPVDFIYHSQGVNRPLRQRDDDLSKTGQQLVYRDQINKVANAIKEIITGLKAAEGIAGKEKGLAIERSVEIEKSDNSEKKEKPFVRIKRKPWPWATGIGVLVIIAGIMAWPRIFKRDTLEQLRSSGEKISVAVMPFQNLTSDTTKNFWQEMIQDNLITLLSNSEELKVRQTESIITVLQDNNLTNYASITPSVASNISQKLDANVFVQGTINQIGTIIRLHAKLIDSKTEEVFKSFQIDGTAEKILPLIDSLSKQVKNSLLISKLEKDLTTDFQSYVSTTSSEAYRNYIFGLKAFLKRDYATAIPFLIQASHCDPDFIYSAFLLAFAYSSSSVDKMDQAKEMALQNHLKRDKISRQYIRIMTDYEYAYFFETSTDQIKYIRQLLQINDQSPADYINLGEIYNDLLQF